MPSRRFLVVVSGAKIYVTANRPRSDRRKRTKDSIATVRHLYLDFDIDGEAPLTSLRTSDTVPTPTAVLSTSLGKYQILCRIDSFTFEQQESALKTARDFLWRRSRLHGLRPGPPLAGIAELQERSVVSHHRQIPSRFDFESR